MTIESLNRIQRANVERSAVETRLETRLAELQTRPLDFTKIEIEKVASTRVKGTIAMPGFSLAGETVKPFRDVTITKTQAGFNIEHCVGASIPGADGYTFTVSEKRALTKAEAKSLVAALGKDPTAAIRAALIAFAAKSNSSRG